MDNQNTPINLRELTTRQLADWKIVLTALETRNASIQQLAYCRAQIDRLESSLKELGD